FFLAWRVHLRSNGNDTQGAPALSLPWILFSGRLAGESKTHGQSWIALRVHPAAGGPERSVFGFHARSSESQGQQLSGGPALCRLRPWARKHPQPRTGL